MKSTFIFAVAIHSIIFGVSSGCSSKANVSPEAPVAAQVSEPVTRRNPALPIYLLKVEPIVTSTDLVDKLCQRYAGPEVLMNASLINALVSTGNFAVLDPTLNSQLITKVGPDERGPFIIRISPTEFSNNVLNKERGVGVQVKPDDTFLETIGKAFAMAPSFWITQITGLPTTWRDKESRGVIAIEVSVVDPKNGQVLTSFSARGSFTAKNREIGNSMQGYYSTEYIASPVESAVRAAMNDAAVKLISELSRVSP